MRVVYDCAAKYGRDILESAIVAGTGPNESAGGVLSRFRQETVGVVADIEGMFHQVLVEPKDWDVL